MQHLKDAYLQQNTFKPVGEMLRDAVKNIPSK